MGRLGGALGRLRGILGAFWGDLGPSWGGLGPSSGRTGGSYGASSGVLGYFRASGERLEPDFRTKLRRSIWDAFFCPICIRLYEEFLVIRTRAKALCITKIIVLSLDAILNIGPSVDLHLPQLRLPNPPKSRLESVLGPLGVSWSVLGRPREPLGCALGRVGGALESLGESWGGLEPLTGAQIAGY